MLRYRSALLPGVQPQNFGIELVRFLSSNPVRAESVMRSHDDSAER